MSPSPLQAHHPIVRARRIGVCGGHRIRPENARFCERLGAALAREEGLVLVSGGFKKSSPESDYTSADFSYISGAARELRKRKVRLETRIETLLPDKDLSDVVRFRIGNTVVLRGRSTRARRFRIVGATDMLVAVEGAEGTREFLDLALALEKPVFPCPFSSGAAAEYWADNRELFFDWFDIDEETGAELESLELADLSLEALDELASKVKELLLHQLRRRCFVMMPFHGEFLPLYERAIKPGIEDAGFIPIRTDLLNLTGDVMSALRDAVNTSACAVAVVSGQRPNVMYELGLAHALGKPVVLLCEAGNKRRSMHLPFDIRNESVIPYGDDLEKLRILICAHLREIIGK